MITPKLKRRRTPGNITRGKHPTLTQGPVTPASHNQNAGRATREQRLTQVLPLLAQGLTYAQIGERFSVSAKTICLDMREAYDTGWKHIIQTVEERIFLEEEKSYLRDRAIMPELYGHLPMRTKVIGTGKKARVVEVPPDPLVIIAAKMRAHARLTDSARFRADLFGLNAPKKVALTDPSGEVDYAALQADALRGLLEEKLARLGLGPAPIDVTPKPNGGKRNGSSGNGHG